MTSSELTRRALYDQVWAEPLTAIAQRLGVSRNGLAKICDRLLIPYPGRNFWSRAAEARETLRPALPPAPPGVDEVVVIAPGAPRSRRPRTRLSLEARRAQLLEVAAGVVRREGLAAATLRRIAREAGISEAQAHNCYPRSKDLLVALARRELEAMSAERESEVERAHDNQTRVALSTIAYLRQVQQRGVLVQTLLNSPDVRQELRPEREAQTRTARRVLTERLNNRYGVPGDLAYGATVVLTALCLRAGRLLAERKIPLEMAERLSLGMVTAGNRRLSQLARSGQLDDAG